MKYKILYSIFLMFLVNLRCYSQSKNEKIQFLNNQIFLNDSLLISKTKFKNSVNEQIESLRKRILVLKDSIQDMVLKKDGILNEIDNLNKLSDQKKNILVFESNRLVRVQSELDSLKSQLYILKLKINKLNENKRIL